MLAIGRCGFLRLGKVRDGKLNMKRNSLVIQRPGCVCVLCSDPGCAVCIASNFVGNHSGTHDTLAVHLKAKRQ